MKTLAAVSNPSSTNMEWHNRQLREQLEVVQLSMAQLARTMQLSHHDLAESVATLCREESPTLSAGGESVDTARDRTVSQRRLALYVVSAPAALHGHANYLCSLHSHGLS